MNYKIFFILILFYSCKSIDNNSFISKNIVAKINKSTFDFKIDTIIFKNKIREKIFSKESVVNFNKIDIIKKKSLDSDDLNYILILYDPIKNLKTARILKKHGKYLVLSFDSSFEKTFVTCVSDNKICYPNIFSFKNKRKWICSDTVLECSLDENENCTIYRSILLNDE